MSEPSSSVKTRLTALIAPRRLAFAVIAPPVAWAMQGALGWFFTAEACKGRQPEWGPLTAGGVRLLLLATSLAALAVTLAALRTAWNGRHLLADRRAGSSLGESAEFLATAGLMIGAALAIGILWAALPAFMVHVCGEMR